MRDRMRRLAWGLVVVGLLVGCAPAFRQPVGELWVYEFEGQERMLASWRVAAPPGTVGRIIQFVSGPESTCLMARADSARRVSIAITAAPGAVMPTFGDCQPAQMTPGAGWWAFSLSGPFAGHGFVAATEVQCVALAASLGQRQDIPWSARPTGCAPVALIFHGKRQP